MYTSQPDTRGHTARTRLRGLPQDGCSWVHLRLCLTCGHVGCCDSSHFIGKSSPVHFFWGSFDLALSFFSGRRAPECPGADRITQEAYSHEVISCGFWPGDDRFPTPAFYSYTAPTPLGLENASILPTAAFYSSQLGEFLLRYEDVRSAPSPEQLLLDFYWSAYEAGATLAHWDREALERNSKS